MLSNAMNTTYDPCNEFYEYSCENYRRQEDVLWAQQDVAFKILAKALRNITERANYAYSTWVRGV
ncbi:hypothetical protein AAVH_20179 [Aphelenchoides avenae]|nr:hypothetical protein AAVH_20179 [Aphelenchus avenae]